MRKRYLAGAAVVLATMVAGSASAATLVVSSYDIPNGSGQDSLGRYNYWDGNYSGGGATTTDNAPLTRGMGALADGHVELHPWVQVSNDAGTGPYVGWRWTAFGDPTMTFHLAGPSKVSSVAVAVDDSGVGGVFAPLTLTIDGATYTPIVTPISATSEMLTVAGLSLTGSTFTLTPNHNPAGAWDFVSEVTFNGVSAVPEPSAWALILVGFAGLGGALRSRRKQAALAT